jgi:isoamylase
MLLGGDEFGRTQGGNNNAYCQDNDVSWLDWRMTDEHADRLRFVRGLIALRRRHPTLTTNHTLGERPFSRMLDEDVSFHGVSQGQPDWGYLSHSLAVHFHGLANDVGVYVIANGYAGPLAFALPPEGRWKRVVDTFLPSPDDLVTEDEAPVWTGRDYLAQPRSVVILVEAS